MRGPCLALIVTWRMGGWRDGWGKVGGWMDVRGGGRMDYLEDLSISLWAKQAKQGKVLKNVAVAWGVPLKTGPEKAPKCTKGFYRWRHSQVV